MKLETSYGIIPVQKKDNGWNVLLIQHRKHFWAFPKGHPDKGETFRQTAERELKEETGLDVVRYITEDKFTERYQFFTRNGDKIFKTVTYSLAEVTGEIKLQIQEVQNAKWVPLKEAHNFVTYPEAQRICTEAFEHLKD